MKSAVWNKNHLMFYFPKRPSLFKLDFLLDRHPSLHTLCFYFDEWTIINPEMPSDISLSPYILQHLHLVQVLFIYLYPFILFYHILHIVQFCCSSPSHMQYEFPFRVCTFNTTLCACSHNKWILIYAFLVQDTIYLIRCSDTLIGPWILFHSDPCAKWIKWLFPWRESTMGR